MAPDSRLHFSFNNFVDFSSGHCYSRLKSGLETPVSTSRDASSSQPKLEDPLECIGDVSSSASCSSLTCSSSVSQADDHAITTFNSSSSMGSKQHETVSTNGPQSDQRIYISRVLGHPQFHQNSYPRCSKNVCKSEVQKSRMLLLICEIYLLVRSVIFSIFESTFYINFKIRYNSIINIKTLPKISLYKTSSFIQKNAPYKSSRSGGGTSNSKSSRSARTFQEERQLLTPVVSDRPQVLSVSTDRRTAGLATLLSRSDCHLAPSQSTVSLLSSSYVSSTSEIPSGDIITSSAGGCGSGSSSGDGRRWNCKSSNWFLARWAILPALFLLLIYFPKGKNKYSQLVSCIHKLSSEYNNNKYSYNLTARHRIFNCHSKLFEENHLSACNVECVCWS